MESARALTAFVACLASLALMCAPTAQAGGHHSGSGSSTSGHSGGHPSHANGKSVGSAPSEAQSAGKAGVSTAHGSNAAEGVQRDAAGRIGRSPAAKTAFKKGHLCPATGRSSGACPGYVVDHVTPLKGGGADKPENMQWQTTAAAKAKDKAE